MDLLMQVELQSSDARRVCELTPCIHAEPLQQLVVTRIDTRRGGAVPTGAVVPTRPIRRHGVLDFFFVEFYVYLSWSGLWNWSGNGVSPI